MKLRPPGVVSHRLLIYFYDYDYIIIFHTLVCQEKIYICVTCSLAQETLTSCIQTLMKQFWGRLYTCRQCYLLSSLYWMNKRWHRCNCKITRSKNLDSSEILSFKWMKLWRCHSYILSSCYIAGIVLVSIHVLHCSILPVVYMCTIMSFGYNIRAFYLLFIAK